MFTIKISSSAPSKIIKVFLYDFIGFTKDARLNRSLIFLLLFRDG